MAETESCAAAAAHLRLHAACSVQSENRETLLFSVACVILAWELFRGHGQGFFQGHKSMGNKTKS